MIQDVIDRFRFSDRGLVIINHPIRVRHSIGAYSAAIIRATIHFAGYSRQHGTNSASLQTIISDLQTIILDLGHKSPFDLLLKEAWNPEVAALGNSTLPTVCDKLKS